MADRLGGALLTVAYGFVTGGIAAIVFLAWVLRKTGDPRAQGRGPLIGLWVATVGLVATAGWLVLGTPFL